MKYYSISNSTKTDVIGDRFPQLTLEASYNLKSENSLLNITSEEFASIQPDLRFFINETSILTDVLSCGNIRTYGFLINEKVKEIIIKQKLPDYRLYPATVFSTSRSYEYYWLHFLPSKLKYVNFSESAFFEAKLYGKFKRDLRINSLEEFLDKKRKLGKSEKIVASKIVLWKEFNSIDSDLFKFKFNSVVFISSRLKRRLEDLGITGLDYKEQSVIIPAVTRSSE